MPHHKYLSTSEYAKLHRISRMQVIRLIRSGKIQAQRAGNSWLIPMEKSDDNQIGLEKTTSLQKWNKIIFNELKTSMHIETSKDRELIYAKLDGLGLPHERCIAFHIGEFPSRVNFAYAVSRLGKPYWISAVPNPEIIRLDRLSKLGIYSVNSGWEFANNIEEKENYKIILSQYPDDADWKGTILISPSGRGIAEFITGDRHYIMTRGFTLTDPMIFDKGKIYHYSTTISKKYQDKLHRMTLGVSGHFELQYGTIDKVKKITFFDYNEGTAYTDTGKIWNQLCRYFTTEKTEQDNVIYGLPASLGKTVSGKCHVIHSQSFTLGSSIEKGDIIVSDTTIPEMTPLMAKAGAIVTDLGGVTSHAAIVCRELAIPAIVGTKTGTEKIKTGDFLTVDSNSGKITIEKKV